MQFTLFLNAIKLRLCHYSCSKVSHIYICDQHKNMIQSARSRRRRRDSEEAEEETEQPEIDLYNLQINTLRRYKRHYGLSSRPGLNKAQLAEVNHVMVKWPQRKGSYSVAYIS